MRPSWSPQAREAAYTRLCDAVTAAGREQERLFLARLCLLLAEELSDPDAFDRALAAAGLANAVSRPDPQ